MEKAERIPEEQHDITAMLDIIDSIRRQHDHGCLIRVHDIEIILEFFILFTEQIHLGRNENYLLHSSQNGPVLVPKQTIETLFFDHSIGRKYITQMRASFRQIIDGRPGASSTFFRYAQEYSELIRHAVERDTHTLFPMVDDALSPVDLVDDLHHPFLVSPTQVPHVHRKDHGGPGRHFRVA